MRRLASVSVDLDSLHHYCRIHGLPEALLGARARALVHAVALPRFRALFEALGIRATFFAIGEDVEGEPLAAQALRAAHLAGHEVASHSHAHDYALTRRAPADVLSDLARADEVLTRAVGERPRGFRAPGYTLDAGLYAAQVALGYVYGSSAFPAAPYWLAKAAVMGAMRLTGRRSRAVLDSPRVLLAPRAPYRPDPAHPYRRGAGPVLELPVAVSRLGRFPFIGTFAATLPLGVSRVLYRACGDLPHLNFELHAVDLLDAADGLPASLVKRQRDLGVEVAHKRARLSTILGWMRRDFDVVPLREVAAAFA
ncbi:MAG: polysaccharide deacetylase family protein [Myxococcaceae bacterium]|nr:polysaccharide deacetylase family protein [Myxococcaceae bacterium]MCI0673111.1 polysaccharide deacetylase family protein [Myxococcaceae bacterium]